MTVDRVNAPVSVVEGPAGVAAAPSGGKRVATNMAILTLSNVAVPLFGLATAPLLARGLGVDQRGAVAAATAPLMLALAIGTFGLPEALVARVARQRIVSRRALVGALGVVFLIGLGLTAAVVLAAPALAQGDGEVRVLIVQAIPFLTPCLMMTVVRAVAQAFEMWKLVALEQALAAVLRLALILLLFFSGHMTAFTATLATAAPVLLGAVVYVRLVRGAGDWFKPVDAHMPDLFRYGSKVWLGYIGGILLLRLDQLVMVPLADAYQLGLYVVAVTVAEVLLVVTNAVRDVTFAADASGNDDARAALTARVAALTCLLVSLGVAAVAPFLVPLFFGSEFAPAVVLVDVLMLAIVVLTPGSVAGAVLIARGYPGRRSIGLVIGAVLNVVVLVVLVPHLGAMGAAIATVVGNGVFGGMNLFFLRRVTRMKPRDFILIRMSDFALVGELRAARARRARV